MALTLGYTIARLLICNTTVSGRRSALITFSFSYCFLRHARAYGLSDGLTNRFHECTRDKAYRLKELAHSRCGERSTIPQTRTLMRIPGGASSAPTRNPCQNNRQIGKKSLMIGLKWARGANLQLSDFSAVMNRANIPRIFANPCPPMKISRRTNAAATR